MASEQIIGVTALSYYLQRIRKFVESKKNTLLLPNISTELRDIFLKIVQEGVGFLEGDEFSAIVKLEANKLKATMAAHKNVKLTHEFKDGTHGPNVLAYRKVEMNTFKAPEPLRKPSEIQTSTFDKSPLDAFVTSIFKSRCLNSTTQFVKDDTQLVMKFPPMSPTQAEFVMTMISQGIEGKEQMEVGYGFRSIYAPLWEAIRVFGLKYRFSVSCADCQHNLMKYRKSHDQVQELPNIAIKRKKLSEF